MASRVEITPWERLQRLYEMSTLERPVYARKWANELASRHGIESMPRYMQTAHQEAVAAFLLSLVDEQTSRPDHGNLGSADQPSGFEGRPVSDASPSNHRSADDVPPSVIRAWAQQKGISIGDRGRIPMWVIQRYHTEHAGSAKVSASNQLDSGSLGNMDDLPTPADSSSERSTADPKIHDFLQILRGESRSG